MSPTTAAGVLDCAAERRCRNIFQISEGKFRTIFFFHIRDIILPHTMATMAAAIAASLPAVQAAPVPVAPTQQTLPASWNKRIDAEAEIPIATIQIDGLVRLNELYGRTEPLNDSPSQVTTKIIKHSLDSGSNAHGLVLGLDLDGVLEISNSFPLPNQSSDEDEKSVKSVGWYTFHLSRGRYSGSYLQLDTNRKCYDR